MKTELQQLIETAIVELKKHNILPKDLNVDVQIEKARDEKHGDFASNIALMLAKPAKKNPRELAQNIIEYLPKHKHVEKAEIAGPGFINFKLSSTVYHNLVKEILEQKEKLGLCEIGKETKIHIEYVSANPTGPLHVGHGRGAVYGSCVSNLLKAAGSKVHREYYVNDAGRQMRILALSIWIRYLQQLHIDINVPKKAYVGNYIIDIAKKLINGKGKNFLTEKDKFLMSVEANEESDPESYLDACVEAMQQLLGEESFKIILRHGVDEILSDIKDDLKEFGVEYDEWFSEQTLFDTDWLKEGIKLLKKHGYVYEKENALWFKATKFDDEKDRVLIRANGKPTYFASDVAYHLYKYNQGYNEIIDVFGADHHGYIGRIHGFLKALGKDPDKTKILLVQFAILYRGKEKVPMSTRAGEFITLRQLRKEVGNDAARYFYIMRKPEQHLDFDLKLAKSQSNENPIYYIQYAHARICSIWKQLKEKNWAWNKDDGETYLNQLEMPVEKTLMQTLSHYPTLIETATKQYAPHHLAHYLQELAANFHAYYNATHFLVEDENLRNARLSLIKATQQVIQNGLKILGLSAPEKM